MSVFFGYALGLFPLFRTFVKQFQKEEPLVHKLHTSMVLLCRKFLALFVKPDAISSLDKGAKGAA